MDDKESHNFSMMPFPGLYNSVAFSMSFHDMATLCFRMYTTCEYVTVDLYTLIP
jgi:hypothetical protein